MSKVFSISNIIIILSISFSLSASANERISNIEQDSAKADVSNQKQHQHESSDYKIIEESDIVDASLTEFSNLHPLIVHFPIVLLLLGAIAQFVSFFLWRKQLGWVALITLIGGFLGAYLASTFIHPHTTGLTDAASAVLKKHDRFAFLTIWLSGIALLFKIVSMIFFKNKVWLEIIVALLSIGSAFTVSNAAHYGATLSQIHGVGVQGNFLEETGEDHNHEH